VSPYSFDIKSVADSEVTFEAGALFAFWGQETCLLRLNPTDLVGLFPPPLHKYLDPKRYRYAVIGSKDDAMGDLIPLRSLVEIDVMQNALVIRGNRERNSIVF
jgi:hypothetical protein